MLSNAVPKRGLPSEVHKLCDCIAFSSFCVAELFSNTQKSPPFSARSKMFNAIKCAYWASTALSRYQKIEIYTKITRHKNNLGRRCKNGIILCVLFIDFVPVFITAQLCNYAAFCSEESETVLICGGDVKNCCEFLSRSNMTLRQIQFHMVWKSIQLTTISKCHLHHVCNRLSGTKYSQRLRKCAGLFYS